MWWTDESFLCRLDLSIWPVQSAFLWCHQSFGINPSPVLTSLICQLCCSLGPLISPVSLKACFAEMAPAKLRGTLNVIFQLMVTIGEQTIRHTSTLCI